VRKSSLKNEKTSLSGYRTRCECDCREVSLCSAFTLAEDSWTSSALLPFCSDPAQPFRGLVFQKSVTPLKLCFNTESMGLETKVFTDFASYCPNLISVNTQLPQIVLDATYVLLRYLMWKFTWQGHRQGWKRYNEAGPYQLHNGKDISSCCVPRRGKTSHWLGKSTNLGDSRWKPQDHVHSCRTSVITAHLGHANDM